MDPLCPVLPVRLLDWLVASERELAAAGDDEARERLERLLDTDGG